MASKAILFLGLLLAMLVLISSEVAARDLSQTSKTVDTTIEANKTAEGTVKDAEYGRDQYGGGYPESGRPGGYGGFSNCQYGCCGYNGNGCTCCTYAGENVDAQPQAKPHN